jgi:hypothetical protein
MYISLYVDYQLFLSGFSKTLIFSTDFQKKKSQIRNFITISQVGVESFRANKRTAITKLKDAIRNFFESASSIPVCFTNYLASISEMCRQTSETFDIKSCSTSTTGFPRVKPLLGLNSMDSGSP